MKTDRNGLEILSRGECLHLLSVTRFGRIGMSGDALPTILPVNYYFDRKSILTITSVGSKLNSALRNTVVPFEIDAFDAAKHAGWSVVAVGVARGVHEAEELERIRKLPITRFAPKGDWYVVSISIDWISGRRLGGDGHVSDWYPPHELRAAAYDRTEGSAASQHER